MSRAQPAYAEAAAPEAGHQYARLRHVLALAGQIAGRDPATGTDLAEEIERVALAYGRASPVAQRRFDALVAEVSAWAAAGTDALALDPSRRPRAAAVRFADELADSLQALTRLLRVYP